MTAALTRALALHPEPENWVPTQGVPKSQDSDEARYRHTIRSSLLSDNWPEMVRAFRLLMGLPLPENAPGLDADKRALHTGLLLEELTEFVKAGNNPIKQADALLDIIYVAIGALLDAGFHPREITAGFAEVHQSNMTKVMDTGLPLINDGQIDPTQPIGKVLKTSNYTSPSLAEVMLKAGA